MPSDAPHTGGCNLMPPAPIWYNLAYHIPPPNYCLLISQQRSITLSCSPTIHTLRYFTEPKIIYLMSEVPLPIPCTVTHKACLLLTPVQLLTKPAYYLCIYSQSLLITNTCTVTHKACLLPTPVHLLTKPAYY